MLNIRDVFLRHPVTDNYRYIGFSDTLVQVSTKYLHLIHTISTHYLRPGPGGDTLQPGGRDPDGAGVGSLPGQRPRAARRK